MSEQDQLYLVEDNEIDYETNRRQRIAESNKRHHREDLIGLGIALVVLFGCAIVCIALIVR